MLVPLNVPDNSHNYCNNIHPGPGRAGECLPNPVTCLCPPPPLIPAHIGMLSRLNLSQPWSPRPTNQTVRGTTCYMLQGTQMSSKIVMVSGAAHCWVLQATSRAQRVCSCFLLFIKMEVSGRVLAGQPGSVARP